MAYERQHFVDDTTLFASQLNHIEQGIVDVEADMLPKTGGDMEGPINMNGQALTGLNPPEENTDAANKQFVDQATEDALKSANEYADQATEDALKSANGYADQVASKASSPLNLLDNSYFINPVNQKENTTVTAPSSSAENHIIDRWIGYGTGTTFSVAGKRMKLTNDGSATCGLYQRIHADDLTAGKTYTLAFKAIVTGDTWYLSYGTNATNIAESSAALEPDVNKIHVFTFTLPESITDLFGFRIRSLATAGTATLEWAALYEGSYNAETLPQYVEPAPTLELLKCKKYLFPIPYGSLYMGGCSTATGQVVYVPITAPERMRITPTINGDATDPNKWNIHIPSGIINPTAVAVQTINDSCVTLKFTGSNIPRGACFVAFEGNRSYLSAEL